MEIHIMNLITNGVSHFYGQRDHRPISGYLEIVNLKEY